ncbi:MAG: hypothetical protein AB1422_12760 [bacterium]
MIKRVIALGLVGSLFWLSPAVAKNPVLLVHGTFADSKMWKEGCLITTLMNAGYEGKEIFTIDFDDKGQGLIQEDVKALKQKIDEIKNFTGADKVDIVAHSRGGIVAELYTMMSGDQYQSTMDYSYYPAGKPKKEKFKKNKTITNIPRYGNDVNQIIMLGTGQMGSEWADFSYKNPEIVNEIHKKGKCPDPYSVAIEQQRTEGSNFMEELFWKNKLNSDLPTITYINLAEDRIGPPSFKPGDGVIFFDSAKGVPLHQQRKTVKRLEDMGALATHHVDLYKNVKVKRQILEELFSKSPIVANISISRKSPVREGAINVYVTTSETLPCPPTLIYQKGGFVPVPLPEIALSGSGKNFSGKCFISKGDDGNAKLYINETTSIPVTIADENCQEVQDIIQAPISGEYNFLVDTEEPEVTATTPANGEVIIAEETPWTVNISATLFDPPVNGYASGIDNSTIVLNTPQGTFHQASAVNNLDYGEYSCSIEAKDNANEPGHDLKQSPYRWSFEIAPPIFVSIHPAWENFTDPHESHTHYITITNKAKNKSFTANIEMKLIRASKCLSITQYPASTLELPADSQASTSFVVTSGDELIPDDNLIHQIIITVRGLKLSAIQYANGQNIVTDHPDESYDISDPRYPTPAKIDSEAEVGVYLNGFVDGVAHLLGRFKEPVWFIDRDLEPLPSSIEENSKSQIPNYKQIPKSKFQISNQIQMPNAANERLKSELQKSLPLSSLVPPLSSFIPHPSSLIPRKLSDFKVLIIPSYGLSGVDTSEILEWRLRRYVEEGGVVVCFTQKYGYEFEFLPGILTCLESKVHGFHG